MTDDVNKVLNERKNSHGDFSDNAATTQEIKELMFNCIGWNKLSHVQREALDMIAHKIGRILAGDPNFKDHWDDIAGYATLVANRCNNPDAVKLGNMLYCAQCDNCMRVNAAGYCMCGFTGCPNAGKKVV